MPNPRKPARLYLKRPKDRPPFWLIIDGTRQVSTGRGEHDLEGANKALAEYLASNFTADTSQRDLAAISIPEVLTLWASLIPADSKSRETRGYQLKALLSYWHDKSLADVKGSTCRAYASQRGVKPGTIRGELKALQAAINTWHRESALPAVPRVTLPKAPQPKERVLERHEVAALLRACRVKRGAQNMPKMDGRHIARVIRLCIPTGTRISAAIGLRWLPSLTTGHIDTVNGVLYRRGQGEADTSKRRPPMRLQPRELAMVRRWKAQDDRRGLSSVITFHGERPASVDKAFASIVKLAGLGDDVTPHTLKHTCITWRLRRGDLPFDISRDTGTDVATILRVYGHHIPVDKDAKLA